MRCFLNLKPIKVISFDLDDTLYDNRPYILKAEAEFLSFMQQHYPAEHQWQSEYWRAEKHKLETEQPEISHDTWQSREQNVKRILLNMGLNQQDASSGAKAGLEHFLHYRSNFNVSQQSLELLNELKQKYRLIGISNGNVDSKRIGFSDQFEFVLHAGNGLKMKPAPDMFALACARLNVKPEEVLHVGDNFEADVVGARLFGCQAAWLNPAFGGDKQVLPNALLPHISLESVFELTGLTS